MLFVRFEYHIYHLFTDLINASYFRDNFLIFTLILKYLLPAICIDSLDNLKDFYGIRFFFVKVKLRSSQFLEKEFCPRGGLNP